MLSIQYPSDDQSNYSFPSAYQTSIPQYTQLQINQYYAQYHCYPPQPYHIIPDYYVQPVTMAQPAYHQPMPTAYDTTQWQSQLDTLDLPTSQAPSRFVYASMDVLVQSIAFPNTTTEATAGLKPGPARFKAAHPAQTSPD